MRFLSRLGHILPVEQSRAPRSSLALGAITLRNGHNLVWFPEGGLSHVSEGELQAFKPGIGLLLERYPTAVAPVRICGTHDALPPDTRRLRFNRVRIIIRRPQSMDELIRRGRGAEPHERIASELHDCVAELTCDS